MHVRFTFNRVNITQSMADGLKANIQFVSKLVHSPAPSGIGAKAITANGTYYSASEGLEGYNIVDVNVSGGGGTLIEKTVNANGVYNASSDSADGYSKVTVSVPASAVDTGTKSISTNGTHDVIGYASANVSVPASAVDSGTKSITANGTGIDVIGYAAVDVAVPNTYAAGDEGKVVQSGALVAQTSDTVTANDTYDTTLINSLTVNVSGGGSDPTDGIIVKARDSLGYPTEVDYYNSDGIIYRDTFGNARANSDTGWIGAKLETVNLQGNSFAVRTEAFYGCNHLTDADFEKMTELVGSASTNTSAGQHFFRDCKALTEVNATNLTGAVGLYAFYNCTALTTVSMPKISELCGYQTARGCFQKCTALTTCTFGSVGYPVTTINANAFTDDTQSGLTITVYTTASYVDTALANIRNGATNATIVIKASEALTYGGTSYAAGDTVVTSTP